LTNPLHAKSKKFAVLVRATDQLGIGVEQDISGLLFVAAVSIRCHPLAQAKIDSNI
jgi:hypothetical protein